jgi:hypothetical protein
MDYTTAIALQLFIVAGVLDCRRNISRSTGKLVYKKCSRMYFETNILDLPNKRSKSLASVIHMQVTYLKGGYVIRETEVVMISRLGVGYEDEIVSSHIYFGR